MSSDGDFKVIGINDAGTSSRFGGDDLDKIAKILNGEDLSLTILIDNEWSFNSSKLILRDSSGDNKIKIATSAEAADWIITIPTLGGNQTPVFEDLEQTLTEKTLDDVTLTGTVTLPSTAGDFLEFVKPHTDGAKEMLAKWRLDEVSTSYLSIENANATNDVFIPSFWFKQLESEALQSGFFLGMIGDTKDTGTVPIFVIDCRTDASNIITTRPLFAVQNKGIVEYSFGPSSADFKDNALINVSIDGDDGVTFDNIPDTALSDNIPLLDTENIFTDLQKIEVDDVSPLTLYKPINTKFTTWGLDFNANDADSQEATYAKIFTSLEDNTSASKDSYIGFSYQIGNSFTRRFYVGGSGIGIGASGVTATITNSGLTDNRSFTFPNESGELALSGALGSIDDLTDVDTSTSAPSNNDVLTWDSTNSEWVPAAAPGASGGEANTLTNVGSENELVKTKVGVNYDIRTLEAGTNVTITQNTDTLTIAATDTNTVTDALTELTSDVLISSPSNLQVLAYNSTSSKWENESFNSEITGTAEGDGNGSSVEFTVNHGLGSVPSSHFIQCYSHSIPFTWAIDSSDFTVTFDSAPGSGTDNVKFTWRVVA